MTDFTDEDRRVWDLMRTGGWDAHAQSFAVRASLSHLAVRGPAAIAVLRRELGEAFASDVRSHHPVASHLHNWAPCDRKWLCWFGEAVGRVRQAKRWKRLRKKLTAPKQENDPREALAIIEVADRLVRAGFSVDFDVRVIEDEEPLVPDIEARWADGSLMHVEVSLLNISLDATTKSVLVHALFGATAGLTLCGRWLRAPSSEEAEAALTRVRAGAEGCRRDGRAWFTDDEDDLLIVGIARSTDDPDLVAWALRRGEHTNSVSGPPHRGDDHVRLLRRLAAEHEQLPVGAPGFVAIIDRSPFAILGDPAVPLEAQRLLLEAAPNVVGSVVISHCRMDGSTTMGEHRGHPWITEHDEFNNAQRRTLVMRELAEERIGCGAAAALRTAFTALPWFDNANDRYALDGEQARSVEG